MACNIESTPSQRQPESMKTLPQYYYRQSSSKAAISGFTLTELLVVIVMVFIVGAMFMPLLLSTREASMLASCANNQRQIGVGCQIYSAANNDVWPTINLPGSVENFYQTTLACRTTTIPGTQIGAGPFSFGQLFFYAGVNNPQVFYCPSVQTGTFSYAYYDAPGYPWPALTPTTAADPMNNGNPFVRCGYNYYPQSRTTTTVTDGGGPVNLPVVTFALQSFTVPNPPGGTSPNTSTEPVPMKTTQLNLNKAVAVDTLKLFAQINHQYRGQPYGLNALFPDGHVRFQPVAGNNKKASNKPFDPLLWDPSVAGGPGQTSYTEGGGYTAGIIMSGFQP
jgi:prepilin-type processing-associated H-X9-DG protein